MFGYYFDPLYFILLAPGMLLAMYASFKVKSTFAHASRITTRRGWSGRDIAQAILDNQGIRDVSIEPVQGHLSDHYDPKNKVLRLSPEVYSGRSIASAGVAAHEVGHAIQDARGYAPLGIRNAIVPVAGFGSNFAFILVIVGILMQAMFKSMGQVGYMFAVFGCAAFTMVVIFQLVNLPVEFNASSRAREVLLMNGLVTQEEDREVGRVLNAAAMTYVAATLTAIMTLLYLLIRSGILGGRRD